MSTDSVPESIFGKHPGRRRWVLVTVVSISAWLGSMAVAEALAWYALSGWLLTYGTAGLFFAGLAWSI